MQKGKFITFEGIEGAGKTTGIEVMCQYLEHLGVSVKRTREPGGTRLGEAIRELLLSTELPVMHQDTELLLMFAARAEHVQKAIRPAMGACQWVVCDRFTDATYAYQGGGRGIPRSRIATLENWVQAQLRPDVTFLLDLDVEIGMSRARARQNEDRFEQETTDFFDRVRRAYLEIASQEPQRFRIIDASKSLEQVAAQIEAAIDELVARHSGG